MIIINADLLSKSTDFKSIIDQEKEILKTRIKAQKHTKSLIIKYIKKFTNLNSNIENGQSNTVLDFLKKLESMLDLSNINIKLLEQLLEKEIMESGKILDISDISKFNSEYLKIAKKVAKNEAKITNSLNNIVKYIELSFDSEPHLQSVSQPKSELQSQPESQIQHNLQPETQSQIELKTQFEIQTQPEVQTLSDVQTQLEVQTQSDVQTQVDIHQAQSDLELFVKKASESNIDTDLLKEQDLKDNENVDINSNLKENTLIVSENDNKCYLPFYISDLEKKLKNNPDKYSSFEDVIEKDYTVSLDLFKNQPISRFREAFNLMKNKEHSSIKSALNLAIELLFNYSLHPAIISACRNIDELDIYLDYLEDNEIEKFDCFNIIFEVAPMV